MRYYCCSFIIMVIINITVVVIVVIVIVIVVVVVVVVVVDVLLLVIRCCLYCHFVRRFCLWIAVIVNFLIVVVFCCCCFNFRILCCCRCCCCCCCCYLPVSPTRNKRRHNLASMRGYTAHRKGLVTLGQRQRKLQFRQMNVVVLSCVPLQLAKKPKLTRVVCSYKQASRVRSMKHGGNPNLCMKSSLLIGQFSEGMF